MSDWNSFKSVKHLFLSFIVRWPTLIYSPASAAASKFCEWIQVGIDVCIPHCKYHVKPHSSVWFSSYAIVHRNHFFCLYQKNKSSESKQASNHCKRVLEAAKLAYANKTKESITSQNLGSQDFWQIASSVLYFFFLTARMCCLLHLIKQNCLLETFLRILILMTQVSLNMFSLLELILNCIIFL